MMSGESGSGLHKSDRRVLDLLSEKGDDLKKRRHTLLFFYRKRGDTRPATECFDAVERLARESGLDVARRDSDALILEGQLFVHAEALELIVAWARRVAEAADVEFDGWECEVLRPKQ